MRRGAQWLGLVAVAFSLHVVRPARAQNAGDQAAAEALFDEGRAAMTAHNYAVACPKLFESNRLDTGIGTSLYLADCYEQNGQTASAWAEFREAAALAVKTSDPREKVARIRARVLEPKLARLVIAVPPAARLPGLHVARDGTEVAPPVFGSSVPIDPGVHTIVVSAPDHRPQTLKVEIAPGPGEKTLEIPVLEEAPDAPAAPPAEASPDAAKADPRPPGLPLPRKIAIGAAVAGVGGIVAGSVAGLGAKSDLDASNAGHCMANNHCDAAGLGDRSSAQSAATLSTVFFIVGGVALAGGAALWFFPPKPAPTASTTSGLRVAPWVDLRAAPGAVRGAVVSVEF